MQQDASLKNLCCTAQGRLRCLGSSSHLKLRFGGGYLLEAHAADDAGVQARLADYVTRCLGGRPLGEWHFGRAKFLMPSRGQVRMQCRCMWRLCACRSQCMR
jgi:hypothetical protein